MLATAGFVPGAVQAFRVRLEFASWAARMRTPPAQTAAIRALQDAVAGEVRRHFAIEADGSFTIDVAMLAAARPG